MNDMGYFHMWHAIQDTFKFHYTQDTNKIKYYVKEDKWLQDTEKQ